MPRLRILHGLISLDVGGLERVVVSLVREGVRRGHSISVVCIEKRGDLVKDVQSQGAEVISLEKPPGRHIEFISRAGAAIDRMAPDVIHTHQIGAAWYLGTAAARRNLPIVHTEHGNPFARDSGIVARFKSRILYRNTSRVIGEFCCVSADVAAAVSRWRTVPRKKVSIVPNGIEIDGGTSGSDRETVRQSLGIPMDAQVIGTVGRLAAVKRQDRLIRAAEKIMSRRPSVWLLIVGEGPERSRLRELAVTLGISDRVLFAGYQSEPLRFLRAMDVFSLTSQSEGLPISLLEAWVVRLPVVCTSVGGIPEVVSDGVDGILVPNDDGPDLERALFRVFESPDLAIRLGIAGAEAVQTRYSLGAMADAYEKKYRALISGLRGTA